MLKLDIDLKLNLQHADYNRVKTELAFLAKETGIRLESYDFFGEILDPGISDIDFVVIEKLGKLQSLSSKISSFLHKDPIAAYCLWHPPVFIQKKNAHLASRLHTLSGTNFFERNKCIGFEKIPNRRELLMISWFLLLIFIIQVDSRKSCSLRKLLLLHKNLLVSYKEFSQETIDVSREASVFRKECTNLVTTPNLLREHLTSSLKQIILTTTTKFDSYCYNYMRKLGFAHINDLILPNSNSLNANGVIITCSDQTALKSNFFSGQDSENHAIELNLNYFAFFIIGYMLNPKRRIINSRYDSLNYFMADLKNAQKEAIISSPCWYPVSPLGLLLCKKWELRFAKLLKNPQGYGIQLAKNLLN